MDMPAWIVIKPRREQAAEVVERRQEQTAKKFTCLQQAGWFNQDHSRLSGNARF